MWKSAAAIAALTLAGCSWAFLEKPPKHTTARPDLSCDDDSRLPLIDGTIAMAGYGAMLGGLVLAIYRDPGNTPEGYAYAGGIYGIATVAVLAALSSRAGERHVHRCARLKRGTPS
ncbi:MAG: hypothetical protein H0V17_14905 [Deltaproteobacteria bacterium]|nr:hypothetical protein [Deltaproteobacteria bacterium]